MKTKHHSDPEFDGTIGRELRDLLSVITDQNPTDPSQLLRSHAELRGALILAGKRIRKLTFG